MLLISIRLKIGKKLSKIFEKYTLKNTQRSLRNWSIFFFIYLRFNKVNIVHRIDFICEFGWKNFTAGFVP